MQARTVTEQARRKQIVDAAIETIAEIGYAKASFARIAERAGLSSTGLISYHFANKSELIEQAALSVITDIGGFVHIRRQAGHDHRIPARQHHYPDGGADYHHGPAVERQGGCLAHGGHEAARDGGQGPLSAWFRRADARQDDVVCEHASCLQS